MLIELALCLIGGWQGDIDDPAFEPCFNIVLHGLGFLLSPRTPLLSQSSMNVMTESLPLHRADETLLNKGDGGLLAFSILIF
jgi:hypothetical protein